jgi:hypothetical protein
MLTNQDVQEVRNLAPLIKGGTATPEQRARYAALGNQALREICEARGLSVDGPMLDEERPLFGVEALD